MSRIIILGSNGFIGSRITELFVNDKNNIKKILACYNHSFKIARISNLDVERHKINVSNKEKLLELLKQDDIVINLTVSMDNEEKNIQNICEACSVKKVKHLIHFSSIAVYGTRSGTIDEYTNFSPNNEYGMIKVNSERIIESYSSKGLNYNIIRPSIVYGPFSTTWVSRFIDKIVSGRWKFDKTNFAGNTNLLYVDDIYDVIVNLINSDSTINKSYIICNSEKLSWYNYIKAIEESIDFKEIRNQKSSIIGKLINSVKNLAKLIFQLSPEIRAKIFNNPSLKNLISEVSHEIKLTNSKDETFLYRNNVFYSSLNFQKDFPNFSYTSNEKGFRETRKWIDYFYNW